ncbi:hypothetical protein PUNSTDRAFT_84375 [Punctularia strigosozonata HHB-11173 SS5]|uniref:uncharacterized protein n=1 Tax=Punctularia strigosozonata (strain HHB-11173) TaxID=741275 RepID=UPI0004416341|nr:uncharacterized protein PUNSTDRAFT_84375 [Punctularia strigosozonata HHB-11173 SS5]EIN10377.1 hypothetical protein PUNSTDRAFT_84375 [Punctularia strigosozonata HHB-11173 SS5]
MAARKLQTEIDRTLKKVQEGVELFESIYDKMQASTNMTQKEKLEADLKTQIKKLQRLRDQIKTWVASNDIKDKSALVDNRKLIETQMEKFKACEKEMKTKAFSKEGLIQSAKLDPKAQEKSEQEEWVQNQIEQLQNQVEQAEAEIEALQAGGKKKKASSSNARAEELERLNERRKWHISRLEIIMRLLDNGSVAPDQVKALHEDVTYFVENNAEEEFEEYEGMYDDLNLDEKEELFGLAAEHDDDDDSESDDASEPADLPPRTPLKKQTHDDDRETNGKREGSPATKKAPVTLQLRRTSAAAESKPPPNPNFSQVPMASILKNGLNPTPTPPPPRPAAQMPLRYASAAAAAVAPTPAKDAHPTQPSNATSSTSTVTPSHPTPPTPTAPSISSSSVPTTIADASSSPSLTHPSVTSPMLSTASVSGKGADGSMASEMSGSPALSDAAATSSPQRPKGAPTPPPLEYQQASRVSTLSQQTVTPENYPVTRRSNGTPGAQQQQQPQAGSSAPSPLPAQLQQASPSSAPQYPPGVRGPEAASSSADPMHIPQQQQTRQASIGTPAPRTAPSERPGSATQQYLSTFSDLAASYESVKAKSNAKMGNTEQVHKFLESGYQTAPQPSDTERPRYYVPKNPWPTPAYYPQVPNPILSQPGIISQLDVETLFYVFYYHPGTYQQYLAAKELKRQSWRFHVKYLTWFQRHSEPQAITDEYEQGVYVYFDWEGSWCQRKKSDFRFEYRYLSED